MQFNEHGRKGSNLAIVLVTAIALAVLAAVVCGCGRGNTGSRGTEQIVLQADPQTGDQWPATRAGRVAVMNEARQVIARRTKLIREANQTVVQVKDDNKLVITLPRGCNVGRIIPANPMPVGALEFYWMKDVQSRNNELGMWKMTVATGNNKSYVFNGPRGEVIDSEKQPDEVLSKIVNNAVNKPILTGKDILANAQANVNQNGQPIVNIEFNKEGSERFADFTRRHVYDILAIFFDGKLLTAPSIIDAIPNGRAEITGFRSLKDAKDAVYRLNSGALPVPLKVISKRVLH